jgi:sec-independent protein translocase protein TatB
MLGGLGGGEVLFIAVIGLLLLGPNRLPGAISEGVKWLRVFRDQAVKARSEIMGAVDLDPDVSDDLRRTLSDISELHPRRIASSMLSDAVNGAPAPERPARPAPAASEGAAAYDPDAT